MDLEKFLIFIAIFMFSALFFQDIMTAIEAVSAAEALKPFLLAIPPIYLLVVGIFSIYFAVSD